MNTGQVPAIAGYHAVEGSGHHNGAILHARKVGVSVLGTAKNDPVTQLIVKLGSGPFSGHTRGPLRRIRPSGPAPLGHGFGPTGCVLPCQVDTDSK